MSRRRGAWGYVIQRSKTPPLFAIRWRENGRSKQQTGFTSLRDARAKLAEIRTGIADGSLAASRRADVTFEAAAQEWLKLHSAAKLRSHDDNQERYTKHLAPFFASMRLSSITPVRLLEFRAKLQAQYVTRRMSNGEVRTLDRKLAPRTINLCMALLRSILRFAVSNGHIASSPTASIGRGQLLLEIEKPRLAPPIDTPANVGRVLAFIREIGVETNRVGLYPLFAVLVYCGLRRGEALALTWSAIDFDRRMIAVRASYAGMTKSKKHRHAPMPPELIAILKAYKLANPWQHVDLVFPNEHGVMYSKNAKLEDALHEALKRAGLPKIRVHDLRHQYASTFVANHGDIFVLQRLLGHSSPQLTSDTYAHLSPTHLAGEAERISYPEPTTAKVLPFQASSARTAREVANGAPDGGPAEDEISSDIAGAGDET